MTTLPAAYEATCQRMYEAALQAMRENPAAFVAWQWPKNVALITDWPTVLRMNLVRSNLAGDAVLGAMRKAALSSPSTDGSVGHEPTPLMMRACWDVAAKELGGRTS